MSFNPLLFLCAILSVLSVSVVNADERVLRFEDVTDAAGLGAEVVGTKIGRCLFADLNGDGWADAVIDRTRVFLSVAMPPSPSGRGAGGEGVASPIGRRFVEVENTGLPKVYPGDCVVFADLDNDGDIDAIVTRYIDKNNEKWTDHGERTAWYPGNGDGTFRTRTDTRLLGHRLTTSAIAVGDINRDGLLDVWLGNWYVKYGGSLAGYPNEMLIHGFNDNPIGDIEGPIHWWEYEFLANVEFPELRFDHVPEANEEHDGGGRPTYGVMIADILPTVWKRLGDINQNWPELIELNYGRRANRLWAKYQTPRSTRNIRWWDDRRRFDFGGDDITHGRYPVWLKERAKTDPRFDREDEKPFRSNGNTFDCAVGDIDNDGDFDIFISEITHGWAGESSDRSRFLVHDSVDGKGEMSKFRFDPRLAVDRIPAPGGNVNNWNQGDLFCELADFNNDTRLDLLLSSGDYPDNQRLRLYIQQEDGTFKDSTKEVGLDHDGSQQISIADVNHDGVLDILVGQTFNRYPAERREGREPRLRLFVGRIEELKHHEPIGGTGFQPVAAFPNSITLHLEGDPESGSNRDALGAIVKARIGELTMQRQLIGIGGHAGKQHDFLIHFGLGDAEKVDELTIIWPNANRSVQTFTDVRPGRYRVREKLKVEKLKVENGR